MKLWNLTCQSMEIIQCGISWKRQVVEWNGWKFRTCSPRNLHVGYFSGQAIWAKFPMLRYSNDYISNSFHPISTKLYGKLVNHGDIQAISFFSCPPQIEKKYDILIFCQYRTICSWKFQYATPPTVFIQLSIKFHKDIGYHGGRQDVTFLFESVKKLWNFDILTWESIEKS